MYETSGKVKWIGDVQSFASGFTKREFVVTTAEAKYPQDLKFEVVKEKTAMLDGVRLGQDVVVSFDIRGNEYNGKYYVNLSCWKLIGGSGGGGGEAHEQGANEPSSEDLRKEDDFDDEIPF